MEIIIKNRNGTEFKILIDDEDFYLFEKYKWHILKIKRSFYVASTFKKDEKKQTTILFHRIVLKVKKGDYVDHINHNGLDNRKCNLRLCNNSENSMNRRKHKNCSSDYKGVCFNKKDKKFISQICINYKVIHLGRYNSEIDAAKAYNLAAIKYFGEFSNLNDI